MNRDRYPSTALVGLLCFAVSLSFTGSRCARADDEPAAAGSAKPERPAAAPEDDELLQVIDPTATQPLDDARLRLERAIENMRSAHDRLAEDDLGEATRQLQSQAVADFEKLLEALEQPPSQSQSSRNQSQSQDRRDSRQQQKKNRSRQQSPRQSRGMASRRPERAPQPSAPGGRAPQPTGAEDRADAARARAEEEARRRAVANDVWGHLPPSVREALQKSFNERYLPKYEDLVRRYYESLAERKQAGSR